MIGQPYFDAMPLPLAHILHWYFMPLYAAPMLIVLYATIRETLRQRRAEDPPDAKADKEEP